MINIGDIINNNKVIKLTPSFVVFENGERLSKKVISKGNFSIKYHTAPCIDLDWCNKEAVQAYYNSFQYFNTYMSNGCSPTVSNVILEVKDNVVYYEKEYYLPCPTAVYEGRDMRWNGKRENIEDGIYNITLYKKYNAWYQFQKDEFPLKLRLFQVGSRLSTNVATLKNNSDEIFARLYDSAITVGYNRCEINGLSIYLREVNLVRLFKEHYVNNRWSKDVNIYLQNSEIEKLMESITNRIIKLLDNAVSSKQYSLDYDNSYGDFSFNYIKFNNDVSERVFNIINNKIKYPLK